MVVEYFNQYRIKSCTRCGIETRAPSGGTLFSSLCSRCRNNFTFKEEFKPGLSNEYKMYRSLQVSIDGYYYDTDLSEKFIMAWINGTNQG